MKFIIKRKKILCGIIVFVIIINLYFIKYVQFENYNLEQEKIISDMFNKFQEGTPSLTRIAMTMEDKKIIYDLLWALHMVTNRLNITYFMWCGTLLGSYR